MNPATKTLQYMKYMLYVLPAFIIWLVFALYPNLQVLWLGFFKWNGIDPNMEFVGLENFRILFLQPELWRSALNTLLYVVFLLFFVLVVGTFVAVQLMHNSRLNRFYRSAVFFPFTLSAAAVGLTFGYLYDPFVGLYGTIINMLGLPLAGNPLDTPGLGIFLIVVTHAWHGLGVPITICLAGLVGIPETLNEAATVDGAGSIRRFFFITLPLLTPTLSRIFLLNVIVGVMAFDYVFAIRSASIMQPFSTLSAQMYMLSRSGTNVGLSAATSLILSVMIVIVFVIQFITTNRAEEKIN